MYFMQMCSRLKICLWTIWQYLDATAAETEDTSRAAVCGIADVFTDSSVSGVLYP